MSSTTASAASTSISNIFPTATSAAPSRDTGLGGQNPTTYYFVFLGVLIVLLIIAGSLSFRAFRLRRRYRTATQLALMRGEALPPMAQNAYWGFGPVGWGPAEPDEVDRAIAATRGRGGGRLKGPWKRIPVLMEAEVDEKGGVGELFDCQPVTVHSLLAPDAPGDAPPPPTIPPGPAAAGSTRLTSAPRIDFRDLRRQFMHGPQSTRAPAVDPSATGTAAPDVPASEMERQLQLGEDVRVAVVIWMPRNPAEVEREEEARSFLDDDEDERPGWQAGMELGVWEGQVGRGR